MRVLSGMSRLYMYAKFRVTECVLDLKIAKKFLGGSAPDPRLATPSRTYVPVGFWGSSAP